MNTSTEEVASEMGQKGSCTIAQKKMGKLATFFAVIKAYCAINVLLLPLSFVNGGYLLSPAAMLVAVFFEGLCAVRLANLANKFGIFSYPALVRKALG
jgi:hypothetical protein